MSGAIAERARDAVALAGLGAVQVSRGDRRRKRNPERVLREAIILRERGLTWKEISPYVGASASWLSLYAPARLRCLSNKDLADRRSAFEWARAKVTAERLDSLVARRRMVDLQQVWLERDAARLREARERERAAAGIEARAVRRLRGEWSEALREARERERAVLREARERERAVLREARERERERRHARRLQRAWKPVRLDRPTFVRLDTIAQMDDHAGSSRHELFAALTDPFDPQAWVEAQLLDDLVGDLSIADIQRMTDDQLAPLRRKLIAEGFAPGKNVQSKERDRLRTSARHRGEGPPATFQRMAPRHRGRKEQVALMSGKRTSRKQQKRWTREKVVW